MAGSAVKNLPVIQKVRIQSLAWEDPGAHGNPLQYSCLENPTDRGAWWATVHRVTALDVTEQACTHKAQQFWFIYNNKT